MSADHEAPCRQDDVSLPQAAAPFASPIGHPFAALATRVAGASEPAGVPFWTDAALIAAAGIPTVVYGPAGDGAHAAVEWLDLASLERVRDVLLQTAVAWCG